MSQWPEPTPDENEPPRWGRWGVIGAVVALAAVAANSSSFRLPDVTMPAFSLPEFTMPEFDLPEAGAPDSSDTPSVAISEAPSFSPLQEPTITADGATVRSMPFESCVQTLQSMADSFDQDVALVEDTADRRVANFKFIDSRLTVTCSRADGTMTVER